jgi:hypothetical protein
MKSLFPVLLALLLLVSCGGGGDNPKDTADLDGTGQQDADLGLPDTDVQPMDTYELPDSNGRDYEHPDTIDTIEITDLVGPDTPPETVDPNQGEPGSVCVAGEECKSGVCLWAGDSKRCSIKDCGNDLPCPFDWFCASLPGESGTVCVPTAFNLCRPCKENSDCLSNGVDVGDRCIPMGGAGNFCGMDCENGSLCPDGYGCHGMVDVKGFPSDQCIKTDGSCTCSQAAINAGAFTSCYRQNLFGKCLGERFCGPMGLSECSALNPTKEVCDGVDNNCNGDTDEGAADIDEDGIADCMDDDTDGDEILNYNDNCPMVKNAGQENLDGDAYGDACDTDRDGDGDPDAVDCAPLDNNRFHGNPESCDGVDNDCVGGVPSNEADNDGDNYRGCNGDCNDNNPSVHPNAPELCSTTYDDDCDGNPNQPQPPDCVFYFEDSDGDGFGRPDAGACLCAPTGKLTSIKGTDCNDQDKAINPLAAEDCNDGKDTNCSGSDTNAANCTIFYLDNDKDAYGSLDYVCACSPFDFYTADNPSDCNDDNPNVNPTRFEDCVTEFDDNCNGTDNDQNAQNCNPFYLDADDDGFGIGESVCLCHENNSFRSANMDDCNDSNPLVYPGAKENCNTVFDDNCNSNLNEVDASGCSTYWADLDGDGLAGTAQCLCQKPEGSSNSLDDCCDTDANAFPGQTEYFDTPRKGCGGFDYDCSGGEDKHYPAICSTISNSTPGWFPGPTPACGAKANLCMACTGSGNCGGAISSTVEGCR